MFDRINLTLQPGWNAITVRYTNALDTLTYTQNILYISADSIASQMYPVTILGNTANSGVKCYLNGSPQTYLTQYTAYYTSSDRYTYFYVYENGLSKHRRNHRTRHND